MQIIVFLFGKLAEGRDVINTVTVKYLSSPLLFLKNKLSSAKFLVDMGASVSVFPHLPRSNSAPDSGVQLRTAESSLMNTYGSCSLALQFGSRRFEWSFLLANVSMPIWAQILYVTTTSWSMLQVPASLTPQPWNLYPPFHLAQPTTSQISIQLFFLPLKSSMISCPSIQMLSPPKVFLPRIQSIQSAILSLTRLVHRFLPKPADLMQKSWNLQERSLRPWNLQE